MPKILTLKQLLNKKYVYLENLADNIRESFGTLVMGFVMIIWGESGNGKSNLTMQVLRELIKYGRVLYLGLEEGHRRTMQRLAETYFDLDEHQGRILWGNHEMTYEETKITLRKKKSPQIIVIDSVQYWDITYDLYKELKEEFPKKIFIFLSHAEGKQPEGKLAKRIKYDADIKVQVEGHIAFIRSRFEGNKPYVIWEAGAKKYWGKEYSQKSTGVKPDKKKKPKSEEPKKETVTDENITDGIHS